MRTILTNAAPLGEFTEVGVHLPGWEAHCLALVKQRRLIKYEACNMPIPPENIQGIREALEKQAYVQYVLGPKGHTHFLMPTARSAT